MIIIDPTEKGIPNNILVVLCAQLVNGKYLPAQRELIVGCAAMSVGSKKVFSTINATVLVLIFIFSRNIVFLRETFSNYKIIN